MFKLILKDDETDCRIWKVGRKGNNIWPYYLKLHLKVGNLSLEISPVVDNHHLLWCFKIQDRGEIQPLDLSEELSLSKDIIWIALHNLWKNIHEVKKIKQQKYFW